MTFLAAAFAGFVTGCFLQFLNEATNGHSSYDPQEHLDACRPTEEDLIDWDKHTSGGRRG